MERIVEIPEGVTASMSGTTLVIKGGKGELSREFSHPILKIGTRDNNVVIFYPSSKKEKSGKQIQVARKKINSLGGTWESHVKNMIIGVRKGWVARLKAVHSHFPMKVSVEGNKVVVGNFLGERNQRRTDIVGDAKVDVKKDAITVTGNDKESVGQTAGNIEQLARVKRFDKRVFQDGIHLTEKTHPQEDEGK